MAPRPVLDPDHPMFARAWARWVVSVAPILWAGFEFLRGDPFWGVLFLAAGVYALWMLILNRKQP